MTVTNENSRNDYTSNGSAVEYAFTFKILDQEDLEVIVTDLGGVEDTLTLGTDYTVELDEDTGLGSITLTTAATVGYTISILRNMDFEQNTSIQNRGTSQFAGKAFEQALDKLTLLNLQLKESIARAILLPKSSLLTELEIPVNSANSGKAIIVNDTGDNLEVKNLADISAAAFSDLGLSLILLETAEAMRTLLSAQAQNANLSALAALTGSVDMLPVFTGVNQLGLAVRKYQLGSVQIFTSSGIWTKPSGCRAYKVIGVGGGGQGGSAVNTSTISTGGGGGSFAEKWVTSPNSSETVTIGQGGNTATATQNGQNGGTTSFGSIITCGGGGGGKNSEGLGVGDGGIASGGDINLPGGTGSLGRTANQNNGGGGPAGSGFGAATAAIGYSGAPGSNYGGGGGGSNAAQAGGLGAPGIVIVYEYY